MKKSINYVLLCVIILLFLGAILGRDFAKADGPSSQIILINHVKTDCVLISGMIDTKQHTFQLEYLANARKDKSLYVHIAESINEFTDIKMIGSFRIPLNLQKLFGNATYSNVNLTKGKIYIVWSTESQVINLSSSEKKSLLERAEATLAEQYRLVYIGAYKSVDEMVDETGKNYEE